MSIKVEKVQVAGWESALRGMRNARYSWANSDTIYDEKGFPQIGHNDMNLLQCLYATGKPDRKCLRQIAIWMDITAPLYFWNDFDVYKVGLVPDSTSTSGKICGKNDFVLDDFAHEDLTPDELVDLKKNIAEINCLRDLYKNTKDPKIKEQHYRRIFQKLPNSFIQTRTQYFNYEVAYNMRDQRQFHPLKEWRDLIRTFDVVLPYFEEIRAKVEK